MAKLGLFASLAAIVAAFTFASVSSSDADDKKAACKRTDYKTELVRDACKEGQEKAKKVMQDWNKEKKIKSCNQCHTKLAPNYELKADAVEQFKKLGGKLIDAAGSGSAKK
jgi:hypothetical protein